MPSQTSTQRPGFGIVELLVVLAIIAFLIAILIPAVLRTRETAARTQSTNNLKNIGLAVHSYHDVIKFLPYCSSTPFKANTPTGGSAHSQYLPYIDSGPRPDESSKALFVHMCPARGRPTDVCWTDYFYNLYLNDIDGTLLGINNKRTLIGITDGSSNTVAFGHGTIAAANYAATKAFNGSGSIFATPSKAGFETFRGGVAKGLARDGNEAETVTSWGGPFREGALMGMCDATVRMFPYTIKNFNHFLTPAGGENVVLPD